MTDTRLDPTQALAAYRSHPKYAGVLAATHPSRRDLDLAVADSAEPDLLGLVTVAALSAGMGVCVVRDRMEPGVHVGAVEQVVVVAKALGVAANLTVGSMSTIVRWRTADQVSS